jgi:hypothetical protein
MLGTLNLGILLSIDPEVSKVKVSSGINRFYYFACTALIYRQMFFIIGKKIIFMVFFLG